MKLGYLGKLGSFLVNLGKLGSGLDDQTFRSNVWIQRQKVTELLSMRNGQSTVLVHPSVKMISARDASASENREAVNLSATLLFFHKADTERLERKILFRRHYGLKLHLRHSVVQTKNYIPATTACDRAVRMKRKPMKKM